MATYKEATSDCRRRRRHHHCPPPAADADVIEIPSRRFVRRLPEHCLSLSTVSAVCFFIFFFSIV
jgi:hypothetical protein